MIIMDAKEYIRAGDLGSARKKAIEAVKKSPKDNRARTLYFQILAFCGEWDKAQKQLDIIAATDPKAETGVQVVRNLVSAEKERQEVSGSGKRPGFLPKPPVYTEKYFMGLDELKAGNADKAKELTDKIKDEILAFSGKISGKCNNENFSGFEDTDSCLFAFLEAFVHERYVWIPFEAVRELIINEPKTLFDLLWIPATITLWDGLTLNCNLPVLYPGSYSHKDDMVKLGRMTDWATLGPGLYKGFGQHVYQTHEKDISLLEIREIVFNNPE